MKELPVEVVVEILSWLPIKPLFRFRCVSKAWLQLFTLDPQFAKLHYDRLIQTNRLNPNLAILDWPTAKEDSLWLALDCTSCYHVIRCHLPFYDNDENTYRLFGICNGLLAIVRQYCLADLCLHIWNPLTNDYINMYPPRLQSYMSYGFGYDQSTDEYKVSYGFGYDQSTDEYKVIGVDFFPDTKQGVRSQVNVFTLGVDSSWRIVEEDNPYILDRNCTKTSLVNGVIHWIAQRPDASSSDIIVGFDLRDEVFREIEPPSDMEFVDHDDYIDTDTHEMGGLLCIFIQSPCSLEIWMMKEYGVFDSWTKLLKIDKCKTGFDYHFEPMGFAQNGDIILMLDRQTLCLFNPETKATRILGQFDDQIFNSYAYVGSIISTKFISRVGLSLEEEET